MIKILFASDLHGSDLVFSKVLNNAVFHDIDIIIIGGDISGKSLTPIVEYQSNTYSLEFNGEHKTIDKSEIKVFKQNIANIGSYPVEISIDQYQDIQKNKEKFHELYLAQAKKRLSNWLEVAESKLKPKGTRFMIMCGNDDDYSLDTIIAKSQYAENPDKEILFIEDLPVLGESLTNMTPFNCPRDVSEEEIEASIENKIKDHRFRTPFIFVSHAPPFNSSLDNVTKLDNELKPVVVNGSPVIIPSGSKAVRRLIEKEKPILSFHGHIHESPGSTSIGETLCINPGSSYHNGTLQSYLVSIKDKSIKGFFPLTN